LSCFSGGLDSTIAVHVLKSKGFDVLALHFVFRSIPCGYSHDKIKKKAEKLGVPVRIIEEGEEYLAMLKNPHSGLEKYKSLHRLQNSPLKQAARIMKEESAAFIATEKVVARGQCRSTKKL